MSPDQTSAGGYEQFYLRLNPAERATHRRKARGYHRRFGRLLDEARPRRVLDLGCAAGMLSAYLRGRGIDEVGGVDANAAWYRGGHKARVFYPTLIAQLYR